MQSFLWLPNLKLAKISSSLSAPYFLYNQEFWNIQFPWKNIWLTLRIQNQLKGLLVFRLQSKLYIPSVESYPHQNSFREFWQSLQPFFSTLTNVFIKIMQTAIGNIGNFGPLGLFIIYVSEYPDYGIFSTFAIWNLLQYQLLPI